MNNDLNNEILNKLNELLRKQKNFESFVKRRFGIIDENIKFISEGLNQILPTPVVNRDQIPEDLVSIKEAAVILNLSVSRVSQLTKNDNLPFVKTPTSRKFSISELNQWILGRPKRRTNQFSETLEEGHYNTPQAATFLNLSGRRVRKLAQDGLIKTINIGKGYVFEKEALEDYKLENPKIYKYEDL